MCYYLPHMFVAFPSLIIYIIVFVSLYFQVYLFITFLESREVMAQEAGLQTRRYPSATIVVPCWNEAKTLRATVASLLELEYPKDKLKIMIVDDGSTDNTLHIAQEFGANPQVEIYTKPNGGKHTAVNFALEHCTTELFGCLDADSSVDSFALERIAAYFDNKEVMAVTPCMQVKAPSTFLQMAQRVEYTIGIFLKRIFGSMNAIQVTPGPFSIFRKKVFDDLGPYKHAHNTEDFEIALRMQKHHYKIANAPYAFVYTTAPRTPHKLFRQRLRWVQGSLLNLIDYKELIFNKKYGALGLLVLPMAILYYFAALYLSIYMLVNLTTRIIHYYQEVQVVGLNLQPSFDWFYLDTGAITFLSILVLLVGLLMFYFGTRITKERMRFHEVMLFMVVYPLLAPFWLWRAGIDTLRSKKNTWR